MKPLCIITGGTSGIGLAIAMQLADRYRIAMVYKSNHKVAKDAEKAILSRHEGGEIKTFAADLTDQSAVKSLQLKIKEWGGDSVDVLIHCAARSETSFFVTDPVDGGISLLFHNLLSMFYIVHSVVRSMYRAKKGSIILFSSVSSRADVEGLWAYTLSKVATDVFCKLLSRETQRAGLKVNCVRPGPVLTRMNADLKRIYLAEGTLVEMDKIVAVVEYFLDNINSGLSGSIVTVEAEGTNIQTRDGMVESLNL